MHIKASHSGVLNNVGALGGAATHAGIHATSLISTENHRIAGVGRRS